MMLFVIMSIAFVVFIVTLPGSRPPPVKHKATAADDILRELSGELYNYVERYGRAPDDVIKEFDPEELNTTNKWGGVRTYGTSWHRKEDYVIVDLRIDSDRRITQGRFVAKGPPDIPYDLEFDLVTREFSLIDQTTREVLEIWTYRDGRQVYLFPPDR